MTRWKPTFKTVPREKKRNTLMSLMSDKLHKEREREGRRKVGKVNK